jgi:hypothetical protein
LGCTIGYSARSSLPSWEREAHVFARAHALAPTCMFAFVSSDGCVRVGRRYHVDLPCDQRAVGCACWAHVRDRRRRRHLRHRRLLLRWHHLQQSRHLPQRRVGEHRWRCVTGLGQGGIGVLNGHSGVVIGDVLLGNYCGHYWGYRRGTIGVWGVLSGDSRGTLGVLYGDPRRTRWDVPRYVRDTKGNREALNGYSAGYRQGAGEGLAAFPQGTLY